MKKKVLGKNELNQHYPIHYGPGKSKLAIKKIKILDHTYKI